MIDISIVNIEAIDRIKYDMYLSRLPSNIIEEILKYRFKDDRYKRVAGKITLLKYLEKYTNYNLSDIQKTSCNRPFISDSNIDFSISYSKNYTICVFVKNLSVGIDIEVLNSDVNIEEFEEVFTSNEFDLIQNSKDKIDLFYRLWTIKEAVLKADGRGFSCDPRKINIDIKNGKAMLQNRVYDLLSFKFNRYIYTLATYSILP